MLKPMRLWMLLLALAGLLAGCSGLPATPPPVVAVGGGDEVGRAIPTPVITPMSTPMGGGNGWLWVASDRAEQWDLYRFAVADVLAGVASEPERMTFSRPYEWGLQWSPNGQHVAYYSDVDGNVDLFMLSAESDFSLPQRLTDHPAYDADPTWDAAGQTLVFMSDRSGNPELYLMHLGDLTPQQLTNHPGYDGMPHWAPIEQGWLAFVSDRHGNPEVYVMPPVADAVPVRLTYDDGDDLYPAWSPDGLWLAFVSNRAGSADIYVIDIIAVLSGRENRPIRVTSGPQDVWSPAWSPDGRWLVFVSGTGEDAELFALPTALIFGYTGEPEKAVLPDLTQLVPVWITDNRLAEISPAWQP